MTTEIKAKSFPFKIGDSWYRFKVDFDNLAASVGLSSIFGLTGRIGDIKPICDPTVRAKCNEEEVHMESVMKRESILRKYGSWKDAIDEGVSEPVLEKVPVFTEPEEKKRQNYYRAMEKWNSKCGQARTLLIQCLDRGTYNRLVEIYPPGKLANCTELECRTMMEKLESRLAASVVVESRRNRKAMASIPPFTTNALVRSGMNEMSELLQERESFGRAEELSESEKVDWALERLKYADSYRSQYDEIKKLVRDGHGVNYSRVTRIIEEEMRDMAMHETITAEVNATLATQRLEIRCYRCHKIGHKVPDCPMSPGQASQEHKRVPVEKKGYCYGFQKGNCPYGKECKFLHEKRNIPCLDFEKGYCRRGEQCRFTHESSKLTGEKRNREEMKRPETQTKKRPVVNAAISNGVDEVDSDESFE
jgi:hypothetical protein